MPLYTASANLFRQLQTLLNELTATEYSAQSKGLSGSTIGQHVRHIIELFIELNKGYASGSVNYEKRSRDYRIETDSSFASSQFNKLLPALKQPDKPITLYTDLTTNGSRPFALTTSFHRELLFNIEHTVHHMALIRVAVRELTAISLPKSFGVAASTLKHQQAVCVQ